MNSIRRNLLLALLGTLCAAMLVGGWATYRAARDEAKDGVWVRVADTGPGMTEEQKKQAFEPFFSTKSKGTGLGLALVHSIMSQHGGEAVIQSAPGRGCEVSLFFPGAPHDKGQA